MTERNEEQMAEAVAVMRQIGPLLHGRPSNVVGLILSLLVARHLAGFVGEDAPALRGELLELHLKAVRALIPIEEEDILKQVKSESH